jgi:plastocyanin
VVRETSRRDGEVVQRLLGIGLSALCVAGLLGACSSKDDGGAVSASSGSSTAIDLKASGFSYDKTDLQAKAGDKVTFSVTNADGVEHNLTIKDLKVDLNVEAGKTARTTATVTAGTYPFFCEYHPDKMKGTLTVS